MFAHDAMQRKCANLRPFAFNGKCVKTKVRFFHKTSFQTAECCWYCTEPLCTDPMNRVGCPIVHNARTNTYLTDGVFCGYRCALAYAVERYRQPQAMEVAANIRRITRAQGIAPTQDVTKSPHWSCLKKFGGYMTIEEFRACPASERPVVEPATSRIVQTGYTAYLYDRSDPVEPLTSLGRFSGQLQPPPGDEKDLSKVSHGHNHPACRRKFSVYTPKPLNGPFTARQKREQKERRTNFAFARQRADRESAAAALLSRMKVKVNPKKID